MLSPFAALTPLWNESVANFRPCQYPQKSWPEDVAFAAKDEDSLHRLVAVLDPIKTARDSLREHLTENALRYLTEEDRSRFWWPTLEAEAEIMSNLWATPVKQRFGNPYLRSTWRLETTFFTIGDCDYVLGDVVPVGDLHHAEFRTFGDPYGGTESLEVLIEGFGHRLVGADGGTGYRDHVPVERLWRSKKNRAPVAP